MVRSFVFGWRAKYDRSSTRRAGSTSAILDGEGKRKRNEIERLRRNGITVYSCFSVFSTCKNGERTATCGLTRCCRDRYVELKIIIRAILDVLLLLCYNGIPKRRIRNMLSTHNNYNTRVLRTPHTYLKINVSKT